MKINSTCLSLNFLTATRHGVILHWQKLKNHHTHRNCAYVSMWAFVCCGLLTNFADNTTKPSQLFVISGGDDSKSQCVNIVARTWRCHFDANVSMVLSRNIRTSNERTNLFVRIVCHCNTCRNM